MELTKVNLIETLKKGKENIHTRTKITIQEAIKMTKKMDTENYLVNLDKYYTKENGSKGCLNNKFRRQIESFQKNL